MRWPKYWSFSFNISPINEHPGLIGSPCSPRDPQESSPTPQFKSINSSALSFLYSPTLTYIHGYWKNHRFDYFVGKVMSLLFNMLSRLVIAFLPRSSSVQSLSHVPLFVTLWTAAHRTSLSITNSWSLLKLMSIESVIPSNHLTLCHPLFLLPSIFPSIRGFSNDSVLCIRWSKYWSFSISPSN